MPHIHTQTHLCIKTLTKGMLWPPASQIILFFFSRNANKLKNPIATKGCYSRKRERWKEEYLHCDTVPGKSRVQNAVSHCEKQIIKADSLNHLPLVRTQAKHPHPIAANKRLPICNAANTVSNIFVSRCHCDEKSRRQSACNYCVNPIGVTHFILEHITEFFNSWPDY